MRVLLAEDDDILADALAAQLCNAGFKTEVAPDGPTALASLTEQPFDLAVLDLGLPGLDGLSVLRSVREVKPALPILILTALDGLEHRVEGLNAGADDYLTKPFSTHELMARVRAVLRRKAPQALDSAVEIAGLRLDPATRRVQRGEQEVKIGPTEFKLLHFFMTHPERVHSRAQLLDRVWGDHVFIEERTVDVHVKRLREALAPVQRSQLIETVRGAGYRLTQQVAADAA